MVRSFAAPAPAAPGVLGALGALAGAVLGPFVNGFVNGIDGYPPTVAGLVVVVSMLPIVLEVFRSRRARRHGGDGR
ncbi:hypothetical protein ABT093_23835 [Kitasatospora sp. NPDC002551]|uniref:hypothetical protein n=1 Tax=unclassified Kitasatospora TaxID=2633591 RepID=UPI0033169983